jgi:hypothetical protein
MALLEFCAKVIRRMKDNSERKDAKLLQSKVAGIADDLACIQFRV